ncbi:peptidyl-tRNA hydrolase domain-containing protein [Gaeumannomyces tritici R3-111a-1]|uniref:Peptidyl-tRNA hydrolase domain-containing protein n=1 Tax=Gaeumannomyces tritici (strain R3-111a-1) TaxID=644352 RepID=J3P3A7_GAET3|nr:peptidyl-tRNA hydrolase domain-containing protein [Gaeumannomyces tritici R3-111a-1]EJT74149.1 peptidyl-tRNA hydrolase domain-containing protein [Gaeumannomyces tritici R3-111a-1]
MAEADAGPAQAAAGLGSGGVVPQGQRAGRPKDCTCFTLNKTNSAVQLKHIPTGLVVKCQATRSRDQNRKIARDLLAAKLDVMFNGEQSRQAIVADSKRKKKASAAKKSKRKYRKLEEQGKEEDDDAGPELEGALEGSLSESQSTGQTADTTAAAASEKHTSHTAPTT